MYARKSELLTFDQSSQRIGIISASAFGISIRHQHQLLDHYHTSKISPLLQRNFPWFLSWPHAVPIYANIVHMGFDLVALAYPGSQNSNFKQKIAFLAELHPVRYALLHIASQYHYNALRTLQRKRSICSRFTLKNIVHVFLVKNTQQISRLGRRIKMPSSRLTYSTRTDFDWNLNISTQTNERQRFAIL